MKREILGLSEGWNGCDVGMHRIDVYIRRC